MFNRSLLYSDCGLLVYSITPNLTLSLLPKCEDGTPYGHCSTNKSLYCLNGALVKNVTACGCQVGYEVFGRGYCRPIQTLATTATTSTTTRAITTTTKKPIETIKTSSGLTKPKSVTLTYVLHGKKGKIEYTAYGSLKNYLASLPRTYYCMPTCPSDRDIELRMIDEENQRPQLLALVEKIKARNHNSEEQARIAISLVQKIPYDYETYNGISKYGSAAFNERYPYEGVYDQKGLCGEKSKLTVFLLRELGYGTALFDWGGVHQAAGVKCPRAISYQNTGYCFIEVARPVIPTEKPAGYGIEGEIQLSDNPDLTIISDGKPLDLTEEYTDAQTWEMILSRIERMGQVLPEPYYSTYIRLAAKYGIEFDY